MTLNKSFFFLSGLSPLSGCGDGDGGDGGGDDDGGDGEDGKKQAN